MLKEKKKDMIYIILVLIVNVIFSAYELNERIAKVVMCRQRYA